MPESEPGGSQFRALALCDRAYAFLSGSGLVSEETLLAHVYGGPLPAGIRARLAEPLLGDPRLERRPDGSWAAAGRGHGPITTAELGLAFTSLALVASGPSPARGRVVQLSAVHVRRGEVQERFSLTVNPQVRVPRYVLERIGMAAELLDGFPELAPALPGLAQFLGGHPLVAQDARLTWSFLEAEARRAGYVLAERVLIDANELATHLLQLARKPTLGLVAAQLGIGAVNVARPDQEARVLGLVATRLLSLAQAQVGRGLLAVHGARVEGASGRAALRQGRTAEALPDAPGIYVLRDRDERPVYVGKARRLRSRLAAYVHRPLGVTRRLEGLVGAVASVAATERATDLEALILEDREIRRLQPRFNTVRQQRAPRYWIRRPPAPDVATSGTHRRAPPRLELSLGPGTAEGEYVGPFRNESLAEQARWLARQVFRLDSLRRQRAGEYAGQLDLAWDFLKLSAGGTASELAITLARTGSPGVLRRLLGFDWATAFLPADPRLTRYAVLRTAATGVEGFVLARGILLGWATWPWPAEPGRLAAELLARAEPRTEPQDADIVLRWFGMQRPPARLVHLPDDQLAATEALAAAISGLQA